MAVYSRWSVVVLLICCFALAVPTGSARNLPKLKSGYEKIHFFLQEYSNVSFFPVVPPVPGHGYFGRFVVADQNATKTHDPASTVIGRSKNLGIAVNNDENSATGLSVVTTIVFDKASGYGNDSTICFQGYYNLAVPNRVLSLTGGTGKFLLARGWLETSTYFSDPEKGRFIQEITAHVYYGKL